MVALDCDIELPVPIDDLRIKPDYPALISQLEKCEFKSLLQEVRDEAAQDEYRKPGRAAVDHRPRQPAFALPLGQLYCLDKADRHEKNVK